MNLKSMFPMFALLGFASVASAQSREEFNPSEPYVSVATAPAPRAPTGTTVLLNGLPQLITHVGGGAGGADASRLQNTSLGMGTIGFGVQQAAPNRIADDFVVPAAGWTINDVTVYTYQTGSTTTSTITGLNFQIWNGDPSVAGSTVVFGDTTTNRLTTTAFTNVYRDTENAVGASNRPIMSATASGLSIVLPAGTYWLDWQLAGSLASGPWAPPITITGQAITGNGLQSVTGTWGAALDGGTNTPAQGFPITIEGVVNESDLSLTKVAVGADALSIGSTFSYDLTVTNAGPADATGVVVTDTLPAQLTYVSNTCGATFAAPTLTWNVGALANGANAACSISVTVAQSGEIVNTASATSANSDPNAANNAATSTITGAAALAPTTPIPATSLWTTLALLAGLLGLGLTAMHLRR